MNPLRTVICALVLALPLSCRKPTEEDKVRKVILEAQKAGVVTMERGEKAE